MGAANVTCQLLKALLVVHSHGLIHGDVSVCDSDTKE
jgi:hypothetical protein